MHVPVLAAEAIEWLGVRGNGVYVDCTAGGGGHSALIAERLSSTGSAATGRLIALDRDPAAVALARERLRPFACATVMHANYGDLRAVLEHLNLKRVDGVLIDAGVSSMQLDDPARGFSFQHNGVLDMRMDTAAGLTASEYLANVGQDELARVLREYGDLRHAKRIARAICETRQKQPIRTTDDLSQAIKRVFSFVSGVPDETRLVFQAIRIAVNDELEQLNQALQAGLWALRIGGRLVVITFHSGEDRVVKEFFRAQGRPHRELTPDGRVSATTPPALTILTRKPVTPSEDEIRRNPRSHSAKLRAAERVEEAA